MGISGGGYAAILFGSLLHIQFVLAFTPPTILYLPDKEPRYRDLLPLMNSTTKYILYSDLSITDPLHPHHNSHCIRLCKDVVKLPFLNFKELRNSGKLQTILLEILE